MRGQGADPAVIRKRTPNLVALAERAIAEGSTLLKPELLYRRSRVKRVLHEHIQLEGGDELHGKLPVQHLAPADEVIVILCSIGTDLEERVSAVMETDMVYALALDGFGSAGVEALANAGCHSFELEARERGLETSIPLSPGMVDWPVEDGQPQIFHLLPAEEIGVTVTPSRAMIPRKSLSMVIGIGAHMMAGCPCDYCSMCGTCRYRDHHAQR